MSTLSIMAVVSALPVPPLGHAPDLESPPPSLKCELELELVATLQEVLELALIREVDHEPALRPLHS